VLFNRIVLFARQIQAFATFLACQAWRASPQFALLSGTRLPPRQPLKTLEVTTMFVPLFAPA
jgi:hypothetical protein